MRILSLILASILFPGVAGAAVSEEFARKLVELRSEVETAGSAYEESLQKRKSALEPMQMKLSELEALVSKEELRKLQLSEKLKATRASGGGLTTPASKAQEWKLLEQWAARLNSYVISSIPFREKERLQRVKALQQRIERKRESAVSVAADLWSLSEKELQLTKDVEYRISRLPLGGQEADVEIARLGMAHLLFLSSSGSAGYSSFEKGARKLVATADPTEKAAIERLVSRLKAKSANGWYEIPGLSSIPREEQE